MTAAPVVPLDFSRGIVLRGRVLCQPDKKSVTSVVTPNPILRYGGKDNYTSSY